MFSSVLCQGRTFSHINIRIHVLVHVGSFVIVNATRFSHDVASGYFFFKCLINTLTNKSNCVIWQRISGQKTGFKNKCDEICTEDIHIEFSWVGQHVD